MKKILTITCHNVYNHGATLQEFALLQYLRLQGHETLTVNYKPDYLSNHFNLLSVSNPRFEKNIFIKWAYLIAKLPSRIIDLKRKRNFDAFEHQYLAVLPTIYTTNEQLKKNLPLADAYICGSDQIWNSFFENGKDPAFYLDFVPNNKLKISYAASFAIDEIEESLKPFVKEKVERIDKISVRESSAIKILEELGINNTFQALDPVFLLEADFWIDKFVKPIDEKFLFVYDCDSNEQIKKNAQKTAKQHNLKIFTVDKNIKYANKNFYHQAPDIFLSLIYSAQFIITNSFHALAFSLIFNKKFYVMNRTEKINTRMRDLLNFLDLKELLLEKNENKSFDNIEIDYEEVNFKLKVKIAESKLFLNDAINFNKNDK
jgi:hypothetical protein